MAALKGGATAGGLATWASRRGGVAPGWSGVTTGRDGESGCGAQGDGAGVALTSRQHGRAARRWADWRRSSPIRQRRLGELDEGRRAPGVLAADPAAAALEGDHGGGASRRSRRRRRFKTSSLPLFLTTEFLAREFLGLSHGEVTSKLSFLHS